jgi:hypothetical protein
MLEKTDLVQLQQPDKEFNLLLADAIDDLAIVAYQLGNHLGDIQTDVTLHMHNATESILRHGAFYMQHN